jgi:hypothetical protein
VCLQQKTAAFLKGSSDLAAVACDGANESLVESLREAIRDCRDNLQQDCTCYWQAPAGFAGKNLTIDIYGGTEFQIVVDGVPLAVQSPASNTPASDAGGEYRDNVDAEPWRAERIRYAFLYNGALAGKYVEAGKLHHDLATDEYLPFYKDGDAINWIADPSGTQACGLFKTMQRVCIGIKRPIYLLSKGETINPVIRFAIDLEDAKNPDAISGLAIDSPRVPRLTGVAQLDNANVIASNAVAVSEQRFASPTIQAPERGDPYVTMASAATRLTASFTASQSPDVSYYMVRCTTADKEFPEEFTFSYARRNASIGSQYGGAITVELDDCGGTIKPGQCVLPGVPPATTPPQINKPGCYKISITPVDLSGNEGDTIIYDQSKAVLPDDNPLSVQKAEAPAVHKAASTSALPQHMIAPLPAVSPASTTSTAQQNPATPTSTAPSTPSSQATQQQVQQTTNSTAALPPWILPWSGKDPYPAIDWSAADPELKQDVDAFDEAWQKKGYSALQVRQVYRPEEYQSHLRTIWETYRILHGLSYTEGYGCDGWPHLDPAQVKSYNLSAEQMTLLNAEYKRHDVAIDPTPPACKSDHSLGIAIDITPPARSGPVFNAWVVAGSSVGLCHYIAGDMPHFALKDELPAGTACNVG